MPTRTTILLLYLLLYDSWCILPGIPGVSTRYYCCIGMAEYIFFFYPRRCIVRSTWFGPTQIEYPLLLIVPLPVFSYHWDGTYSFPSWSLHFTTSSLGIPSKYLRNGRMFSSSWCCETLGRRLVDLLPVAQRTSAFTNGVVGRQWVVGREFESHVPRQIAWILYTLVVTWIMYQAGGTWYFEVLLLFI